MTITVRTRSQNDALYQKMKEFIPGNIPCFAHKGYSGWQGAVDFLHDAIECTGELLLILDEDAFITNWKAVEQLAQTMLQQGYSHTGVPDGGVISHRQHSFLTMNPFFVLFNCSTIVPIKRNISRQTIDATVYSADMEALKTSWMNDRYAHNYFEPFDGLFYWLAKVGKPLFLPANTLADGISTEVIGPSGESLCLHSWYSRLYDKEPTTRQRIDAVYNLAVEQRIY
jgi:hypothetical protein